MTHKKQKRKELRQLNDLRALLPDFPEGKVTLSEKPDFVIQSDHHKVGIEVTSIFVNDTDNERPLQAQEAERQSMLDEACRLYETMKLPHVQVRALFLGPTKLNKHNRSHFARVFADLVAKNIPSQNGFYSFENNFDAPDLFPTEISSIHYVKYDFQRSSFASLPIIWSIQEDFSAELQKVISGKDILLSTYQKCDEYWLLIVAEWAAPSSYFDPSQKTKSTNYRSDFDRVFFLNALFHAPTELALSKRAP